MNSPVKNPWLFAIFLMVVIFITTVGVIATIVAAWFLMASVLGIEFGSAIMVFITMAFLHEFNDVLFPEVKSTEHGK